jgi:hypothetical protein
MVRGNKKSPSEGLKIVPRGMFLYVEYYDD